MKANVRCLVFSALTLVASIAGTLAPAAADTTTSAAQPSGIVSFIYGGTITDSSLAGVNVGTPFSGTFTYDSTLSNGGTIGTFDFSGLPIDHTLSIGAGTFADSSISSVAPTSPLDQFVIQLTNNGLGQPSTFVLTANTLQSPSGGVTLTLTDPTGASFATNQLPTTLSLANLSSATITYDPPGGSFSGTITSLQQLGPAVPEPASVVLLGLGVVALSGFRLHRRVVSARSTGSERP